MFKKSQKSLLGIVAILQVVSCSLYAQETFSLMGRTYKFQQNTWYTFFEGRIGSEIIPNEIILRLVSKGDMNSFDFNAYGIQGVVKIGRRILDGFYVLTIDKAVNPFLIASYLEKSALFDVIEFNGYGKNMDTPNDPYFQPDQWNLKSDKLDMEHAWNITTGDSTLIVAIVDEGVLFNHEDLIANIWQNVGEDADGDGKTLEYINGNWVFDPDDVDGADTDGNNFIDDLIGWDFYSDDNYPDAGSHGTEVAGIIGAATNNNVGLAGIAGGWNNKRGVRLMILRDANNNVLDYAAMAGAIQYAADNEANVINISQGGDDYTIVKSAVDYAASSDAVVVCSAGNGGDQVLKYPARYFNTISVGSTTDNDERWSVDESQGSQLGDAANEIYLDVMAPGGTGASRTPTTESNGDYGLIGKTSGACAHVSALAALIRSVNSDLNWSQVRYILRNSADKVSGMAGANYTDEYGYGRINAYEALKYTLENYGGTLSGEVTLSEDLTIQSGTTLTIAAGTVVKVDPGVILYVNGTLNINGEYGNEVTLTRSGTSGTWDGIQINYGGSGAINYATIDYADRGIYAYSPSSLTVQNCTIEHFTDKGIHLYSSTVTSSAQISNNLIRNPNGASHGIYIPGGLG